MKLHGASSLYSKCTECDGFTRPAEWVMVEYTPFSFQRISNFCTKGEVLQVCAPVRSGYHLSSQELKPQTYEASGVVALP